MRRPVPISQAVAAAVLLPPAMLAIYGLCAWLTRGPWLLSTFHFAWEGRIPLVPWMIVPYLSLDALIVIAILLCRDSLELRRLVRSLLLTTIISGAVFVLWPMRMGFERVAPPGPMSRACAALWAADPSYNRFPSLHVAIAVILWVTVTRASRPCERRQHGRDARVTVALLAFVHVWFVLVILSTLLTWQHHVVDVIAGAALGGGLSINFSRRFFSRRNSSSAPGPKSHRAAVQPNATPVHVPR